MCYDSLTHAHRLALFLAESLEGFTCLDIIETGDDIVPRLLESPDKYRLNHIAADLNAWYEDDRIVVRINNGVHMVFTPHEKMRTGLLFDSNSGQWNEFQG